ncbi:MAG: ATP-binding protein [Actinomycetota bacterium]|nr:ATP-binding protein [Actinomycetota bacterium]
MRRSEQSMVLVRWGAATFALIQVLAYDNRPYPSGTKSLALALVGALVVVNVVITVMASRELTLAEARALSIAAMTTDIVIASGFVWLYAFDPASALWVVLFILPLEGAIRFALPGAILAWGITAVLYVGREVWGSGTYGYPLQWNSVSFRMGIGLLIGLVAGLMARNLVDQRERLESALTDLSRIDRLRSRLVTTLAHDVRGPLTTIRGSISTLLRYGDRVDPETREQLLRDTDSQAKRLERLATELLDLARLEAGRLDLHVEELPVRSAIQQGLDFVEATEHFEILADPDLTVRADPARLEQIIVNLSVNALRYGGPPFVIEAEGDGNGKVIVRFSDRGPGVPKDEESTLFEPFRTERNDGSVGFGLAIVRALAEAQGGEVSYQPNVPTGACFVVTLPAGAAESVD